MRNTYLWLLQLITGILIAVLLGIHMVTIHLDAILGFFGVDAAEPISWGSMISRAGQGVWMGLYIALLAFVLYHALNGLRGIVLELTSSPRIGRAVTSFIIALGIVAFIWGAYVPIALFSQ